LLPQVSGNSFFDENGIASGWNKLEVGMTLKITGRHMDVTPALRSYVETRLSRLDRYGLKVGSLQVILGVEKLQHKAEVTGIVSGKRVQAKITTPEMYAIVDRVDAQFRKLKERLVSHKPDKPKKRSVVS
jgi:putative sigma-54 modulation protein